MARPQSRGRRPAPADTSSGFARAINEGDLDGALSFWAADAVMIGPDGTMTRGTASLRARFAQLVQLGATIEIAVTDPVVTAEGATARTTMTMTVGSTTVTTRASVTYAVAGDELLIARDEIHDAAPL